MPAQTLLKMTTQAAIRAVSQITDLADMPYELARPILLRVQSPQQLREIEVNCPQIAEHSEELWKSFIARDIPDWEKRLVYPKNPNSWHKVYRYLQRQEEKKAAEDEEALRKAVQGETLKKSNMEAVFVKKVLPHARAEDEHNIFIDGVARRDLNDWGIRKKPPTLKNAKTGKDAIAAIRRQTAQASREKAMSRPWKGPTQAQQLVTARRQIREAPSTMLRETMQAQKPLTIAPRELLPHERSMMADYRRAQAANKVQPPTRRANALLARRNQDVVKAAAQEARAENEAKLRALTQPKHPLTMNTKGGGRLEPLTSPVAPEQARSASPPSALEAAPARNTNRVNTATSPPGTNPPLSPQPESTSASVQTVKKRPAQSNIFMTSKKRKA